MLHNSKTTQPNFCACWVVAIHYVLVVLRMTSCFHTMALWCIFYSKQQQNITNMRVQLNNKDWNYWFSLWFSWLTFDAFRFSKPEMCIHQPCCLYDDNVFMAGTKWSTRSASLYLGHLSVSYRFRKSSSFQYFRFFSAHLSNSAYQKICVVPRW